MTDKQVTSGNFILDIVIPCYNEEAVVPGLLRAIGEFKSRTDYTVRVLFVDDGSTDATPSLLKEACRTDPSLAYVGLSRNFGHQSALSTGLRLTSGAAVAVIDADLQDPLPVLAELVRKWREGFDVVYGVRRKRKESPLHRAAYALHYRLLRLAAEVDLPLDAGDFCVMSRRVVDVLNSLPERSRYVRGLRAWAGFRQTGVPYERDQRTKGKSKYSIPKLLGLAASGYISFSVAPLRLAVWVGLLQILFGVCYGIYALVERLVFRTAPSGWTSLAVLFLLFGGIQVALLGIIGEYIGQIVREVKRRPEAVLSEVLGWPSSEANRQGTAPGELRRIPSSECRQEVSLHDR